MHSSPSFDDLPPTDSGKGTSTGSSRPSSQVISVDTEEGLRPGRSWSLGKTNVLSPLTDQVAPAPSEEPAEDHKINIGTEGSVSPALRCYCAQFHIQHTCILALL